MKRLLKHIMFCLLLTTHLAGAQKSITINNLDYKIISKKVFLKDNLLWVTYKTYTLKDKFQFGYAALAKRNDSIFIRGMLDLKGKSAICTEKYFFSNATLKDSVVKTFLQKKNGTFILKKYLEYKNGKVIKTLEY